MATLNVAHVTDKGSAVSKSKLYGYYYNGTISSYHFGLPAILVLSLYH